MKKVFVSMSLLLCLAQMPFALSAQDKSVTLKAGTKIELKAVNTVMARDAEVGASVKFQVVSDVKQNGKVLIPAGLMAEAVVTEAKKSSLAGTKGKLYMEMKSLTLGDGTKVSLTGSVRVNGKNRTPLAVATGIFLWPCLFIPGTGAMLHEGYDATATVLSNTEVTVD